MLKRLRLYILFFCIFHFKRKKNRKENSMLSGIMMGAYAIRSSPELCPIMIYFTSMLLGLEGLARHMQSFIVSEQLRITEHDNASGTLVNSS